MKSGALWVHCWGLAVADFGSNPRSSDSLRGRRYFVSGEVNNAQFHQFPSDKFHKIWTQQRRLLSRWKRSEHNFKSFTIRGHTTISDKIQRLATLGHPNYAIITDRRKFTTKWSLYGVSSFHFTFPLESIQNHSQGLYAPYKKTTQIFGNVRCPILGVPSMPLCGGAKRHEWKPDLNSKLKTSTGNTADIADITQSQARDSRHR